MMLLKLTEIDEVNEYIIQIVVTMLRALLLIFVNKELIAELIGIFFMTKLSIRILSQN